MKRLVRRGSNPGDRRTSTRAPASRTTVRDSQRCGAVVFARVHKNAEQHQHRTNGEEITRRPASTAKRCAPLHKLAQRRFGSRAALPRASVPVLWAPRSLPSHPERPAALPRFSAMQGEHFSVYHHIHRAVEVQIPPGAHGAPKRQHMRSEDAFHRKAYRAGCEAIPRRPIGPQRTKSIRPSAVSSQRSDHHFAAGKLAIAEG